MDNCLVGGLTIEVSEPNPGCIRLDWRGNSNDRSPADKLDPFFSAIVERAVEAGASVEMHFEELGSANSSTIATLVRWMHLFRGKEIKTLLTYSLSRRWQRMNFEGLRMFERADGLIELRALG